ncbi:MDR family MFS transporter [Aeromicrobium sp. IC_218]|uniref:MDR family MFS transporter n=1 Tax=Aeromicrobium sp. IC_218 TaxID=2545468 RepID=UPI00103D032F|nr:MDR family MFS transporter [Aeromicrobium sp. IC_218]TCJ00691.1 DHA2 family efflux MFS transporter permease subunit [Aeromicrobium sp. IC_218]
MTTPDPERTQAEADADAARHRAILKVLTGLLLGMFVSMLATTVVSSSLPIILADLHGGQTAFTWVVTATLLTTAVSTPIWGKLADLVNRKLLLQLAITIFIVASASAGFAEGAGWLIAMRAVQGIGAGGLGALTQIVMADIVSPRERGRYMGLFGGVMALATVGGPLLGGVVTDAISWRWNFFIAVPLAVVALVMIQRTLHLPPLPKRVVKIDYVGIVLLAASVSTLLIWVTLVGKDFDWISATSAYMVIGSVLGLAAFVAVEVRHSEPLLPLHLFRNRTFSWSVVGSLAVGVAMFGTSVFLSQYMQLARGASATQSGLMTIPMMVGLLGASAVIGRRITASGRWKGYLVGGAIALTVGLLAMGSIEYDTPFVLVSVYMFVLGAGVGIVMQNLVLVVQNDVEPRDLGVASSGVTFFRSVGGTVGVSVLGSILGDKVVTHMGEKRDALGQAIASLGEQGRSVAEALHNGTIPSVSSLPGPVREIVESVYGQSVADIFLYAAPLGLLSLLAVAMLPNKALGTQTRHEKQTSQDEETAATRVAQAAEAVAAQTGPDHPGDGRDHHQ